MQLQTNIAPAREESISREGRQTGITVENGQGLRIETSPGGSDILDASPPVGKKWINVTVKVQLDEVSI